MTARISALSAAIVLVAAVAFAYPGGHPARAEGANAPALADSYKLQAAGDLTAAIKAMRDAVEENPKVYFPRLRLAYLQLVAGDYAGAAESYRQAATLEPSSVEPLLGMQQALVVLERWDLAEKAGREVLSRDARNYLGLSRLAWTLSKKKDFKGAAEMYGRVLVLYPGDVDMRLGLANSLLQTGKKGEAAAAYREIIAMVPGHPDAIAGLNACK